MSETQGLQLAEHVLFLTSAVLRLLRQRLGELIGWRPPTSPSAARGERVVDVRSKGIKGDHEPTWKSSPTSLTRTSGLQRPSVATPTSC